MTKSITQITQNDKQLSKSIKKFFIKFHISSALKASNAYKKERFTCGRNFLISVFVDFF